jgi:hypothetical protein
MTTLRVKDYFKNCLNTSVKDYKILNTNPEIITHICGCDPKAEGENLPGNIYIDGNNEASGYNEDGEETYSSRPCNKQNSGTIPIESSGHADIKKLIEAVKKFNRSSIDIIDVIEITPDQAKNLLDDEWEKKFIKPNVLYQIERELFKDSPFQMMYIDQDWIKTPIEELFNLYESEDESEELLKSTQQLSISAPNEKIIVRGPWIYDLQGKTIVLTGKKNDLLNGHLLKECKCKFTTAVSGKTYAVVASRPFDDIKAHQEAKERNLMIISVDELLSQYKLK